MGECLSAIASVKILSIMSGMKWNFEIWLIWVWVGSYWCDGKDGPGPGQ